MAPGPAELEHLTLRATDGMVVVRDVRDGLVLARLAPLAVPILRARLKEAARMAAAQRADREAGATLADRAPGGPS